MSSARTTMTVLFPLSSTFTIVFIPSLIVTVTVPLRALVPKNEHVPVGCLC